MLASHTDADVSPPHPPLFLLCCSVLQCVAVCCSVLQCAAVRYSVLQCVAVCCDEIFLLILSVCLCVLTVCCSLLQSVAVCCSVLQTQILLIFLLILPLTAGAELCHNLFMHVCCVLQCVAMCCRVLQ